MEDRPPTISILLFVAAPALLIAMWLSSHNNPTITSARTVPETPEQIRTERSRKFAQTWSSEPDYTLVFNALDPSFDIVETATGRFDPNDDYFGLPRSEGYELVYNYCSACHSMRIVMQQHATRDRWAELLGWMEEKQGMPKPPPGEKAVLVDYLSRHFGAGE